MKAEHFDKMMEGIKWGSDYLKGKAEPTRRREVVVMVPDVKDIRGKLKVSQAEFAEMLGISIRTVQGWEQRRRVPEGPARVLLALAAAYPDKVREIALGLMKRSADKAAHGSD